MKKYLPDEGYGPSFPQMCFVIKKINADLFRSSQFDN